MKCRAFTLLASVLIVFSGIDEAAAIGRRGGGGGGGRSFGGGGSRPAARPAPRPAPRPTPRPSTPHLGGSRPTTRTSTPSTSRPSVSRPTTPTTRPSTPSGGLGPSTRPSPPSLGDSRPSLGDTRPSQLPGGGTTRPSTPDLGGSRPSTRPGTGVGDRPSIGDRPGIDTGQRPSAGDVGDFLGLSRPSERPSQLPGGGDRPGVGDRPGTGNRPTRPDRGDVNLNINNRPSWVNISNDRINNIHNNWREAFRRPGWRTRPANRMSYWNNRGNRIRGGWWNHHRHDHWFGNSWWNRHRFGWCGWHYHYGIHNYPWNYWWTVPVWGAVTRWWNWAIYPQTVWAQPVYYDYGDGGNVTYENNNVYIGGEQICTADEFAQSAADLATVSPPADDTEAEAAEWLPLGTFAVVGHEQEEDPSRVIQLAVDKSGVISGTLYNTQTDDAQAVQGQVDKETQRAAFRIGESEEIVIETGIYNLTEDDAPILVHFGTERVETWLLVRLDAPVEEEGGTAD